MKKLLWYRALSEYIIAESDNALLICERSQEQQLRKIVNDIKLKKGEGLFRSERSKGRSLTL
jgi:mannose-1-phosphate guanylyltransferase